MNYYNFKDFGPKIKHNDDIESGDDAKTDEINVTEYYVGIIMYYIFCTLLLVIIYFCYHLLE